MSLSTPRIAVISGGSSGIGLAMVERLAGDGWIVHTCGRDALKLERLRARLPAVQTTVCDVADRAAVQAFADHVLSRAPRVDLLVSNAGGLREVDFTGADLRSLDLGGELRTNTEGALNLIAAFMPGLRSASRSAILIVSSGYALAPATRAPLYSASKAALHSLAGSLRRQLAPLAITVTELLPPLVDTPAVAHRPGRKMPAATIARLGLEAALRGRKAVHPGPVGLLRWLLRLMPSVAEAFVART
ncbi:MAG: SDR family NAD(P)-dependent oxidoreductase [Gammaproteobacteria bacterium]|jgi:uncharacterized oxidoreductase|nr:SDR family NAD(P)-dependent oxidoreductase [Gammaproteobacteria bacterium]